MQFPRRARFWCPAAAVLCTLVGCVTTPPRAANPQIPVVASTAQLRAGDTLNVSLQGALDPTTSNVQTTSRA